MPVLGCMPAVPNTFPPYPPYPPHTSLIPSIPLHTTSYYLIPRQTFNTSSTSNTSISPISPIPQISQYLQYLQYLLIPLRASPDLSMSSNVFLYLIQTMVSYNPHTHPQPLQSSIPTSLMRFSVPRIPSLNHHSITFSSPRYYIHFQYTRAIPLFKVLLHVSCDISYAFNLVFEILKYFNIVLRTRYKLID